MLNTLIAEIESEMERAFGRISYSSKLLLIKVHWIVTVAGIIYAAIQTVRNNGIRHDYYTRLTEMKRMMALAAVSRKLLEIIYTIVRDDGEYTADLKSIKRQVIKRVHKVLLH